MGVRLNKAERRVKSLSHDLSQAYEKIVGLLDERIRAEDAKARNEALVAYLNVIGRADLKNEAEFTRNKNELCTLLECCRKNNACQERLESLEEECRNKQVLIHDIIGKCT